MRTYTEIIGFDLGHAETAIMQTQKDATTQPKHLKVNGESPVITAVAEEMEGQVEIGENAVISENQKSVRVMFKSPHLENPETRHPTKLFVQKIVTILSEQKQINGAAGSLFVVGCPSGWPPETRAAYEALLREAGMQHVMVIPESRGAFLSARESRDIPEKDLRGSVLIVDIGSSTTDFTAVSNLEAKPIDFGENNLGAGLLDKIIFKRSLNTQKNSAELKGLLDSYPPSKAKCLLLCRKAKEKYFNKRKSVTSAELITDGTTDVIYKVKISSDREMDEVLSTPIGEFLEQPNPGLGQLDWKTAFRIMLEKAEKKMDTPPQSILLTGGASRMKFVESLLQEVFPEAREVKRGAEPEYAIAQGLALAGRLHDKMEKFRKDFRHVFESGQLQKAIQTDSLKKLIDGIVDFLVPELERIILSAFRDWRNGHISTLNGMESATESRIKQYLESLKEEPGAKKLGEKVIKDWIDTSVRPVVNDLFTPICDKAGIPPDSSLRLSQDFSDHALHVRAIPSSDIEATDSLDNLSLIAAAIGAVIIATLLGGSGAALLMSGPIGWILGLIIGAIVMFIGREAAMDMARDIDLPKLLRQMMTSEEKVRKKLRENRSKLRRQLSTALRGNASAFDKIINGIAKMVKDELKEKAEEAAMLIK